MPTIQISEDQAAILLRVYNALGHADRGLSEEEKIEVGLGALIDSFDVSQDAAEEQRDEGTPIDRKELMQSIEKTLSPSIAMDVVVQEGVVKEPKLERTFEDFATEAPTNALVVAAKAGDEFDRKSVCVLFTAFRKEEWNSALVADMWKTGAGLLRDHAQAKNVVDKG